MSKIIDIKAREILDSRGEPTVEVDVILETGILGRASVPSGASTGKREALELRDNDNRFCKKGVLGAIKNVNILKESLLGLDSNNQRLIDETMIKLDGTSNKSKFGANAILGISLANLKASALDNKKELYEYVGNGKTLPIAYMNILNGGKHADNDLDFQEFMIIPIASTFKERVRMGSEIFHSLKKLLKEKNLSTNVGDEGGFAPLLTSNKEALELLKMATINASYEPNKNVFFALDVAASEFYKDGYYFFEGKKLNTDEMINYYEELINTYPIISIEDPLSQNDWEGFTKMTERLGKKISIVGDDLFVTNKKYLQKGINLKAGNSILIKFNQVGTITETFDTIKLAKENGFKTIISHRSGETEDVSIADLAVGLDMFQIKTGSLSRTDRVCKYNRLMRIEEEIEDE